MGRPQNSPRGMFAKSRVDIGPRQLTANSTGFVVGTTESAIPTTDDGAAFTIISNSTGVAMAINSTGTTWKYLNVTSVQPT